MDVTIERVKVVNDATYVQVRDLLVQLYPQRPLAPFDVFKQVVEGNQVRIYVAILEGKIVGTSTLAFYRKLCGDVWVIEDVVVDSTIRSKGIGTKLTERMLQDARAGGAEMVDLTTRSEDARKFYIEKCGFKDKAEGRPFWGLRYTF